ncbi:methyltransferase [Lentzea guizhouensis]|uniref:Methyltransferase n=1 Tax=Lentzea guizhouensis TaxID=1586287 RepID=A0A1B2HMG8_9PSEU|nr:class I SAM-dependent methyltransferase [Lentzea guizhouensis]ANZ38927.1 methyltransferase [Lentzea guizhouensis]
MSDWLADTRESYDTVAASYASYTRDLLPSLPYMRAALGLFAAEVRGEVADVGCGPGVITAHLAELGVDVFGIDLSPEMIALARRTHPGLRFEVGSMTDPLPGPLGGVLAWWSLIHVPDSLVPLVLRHFHDALRPSGLLALGFHIGDRTNLKTQGYGGLPMRVNVHLRRPEAMAGWVREAGFRLEAQWVQEPDADVPAGILFARRG